MSGTLKFSSLLGGTTLVGTEGYVTVQAGADVLITPAQQTEYTQAQKWAADLLPDAANTRSLGSAAAPFKQLYLGPSPGVPVLNAGVIGYWPLTPAEAAAGVTPTNYQYAPYTLLRYGADPTGTTDSTTALQNAINCAQQANYAIVTIGVPGAKLKISGAWTIDTNKTGIDFQGAWVDASAFAAGNWLAPAQSYSDVNMRVMLNGTHPIKNASFVGPGTGVTAATCLYLNDTSSPTPLIAGLRFQNISFVNWAQDVVFSNGSFANCFYGCQFAVVNGGGGAGATYGITNNNGSNSGEREIFINCAWYNKGYILNQQSGTTDVYFIGCSLDTAIRAVNNSGGGKVFLVGCHVETNNDTDYCLYCINDNSQIILSNCQVTFDVARNTYSLAYSDSSCIWGGVIIDGLTFAAANGYAVPLIAGVGNARATRVYGIGTAAGQPHIYSLAQNAMGDNIFQGNSLARDGWTASGSAPPAVVASNPYSGTYSVEFNPAASQTSILNSRVIPCKPGQQGCVRVFTKLPTFNTGASFIATCGYVDAAGIYLSTYVGNTPTTGFQFMNISAAQAGYQEFTSAKDGGLALAPPGTVGFQVDLELITGSGGGATGYLGEVDVTVD